MRLPSLAQLQRNLSATVLNAFEQQSKSRRHRVAEQSFPETCLALESRILLSAVLDVEPNNTVDKASDFGVINGVSRQTVNGTLSSNDLVDLYQFTLTGNTQVSIQLSGLTSNTRLRLYGDFEPDLYLSDNYEQLESVTLNSNTSLTEALSAGKYFIQIQNVNGVQQSYSLSVLAEQTIDSNAGNRQTTATPLIANAAPIEDLIQINEQDFYTFTMTQTSQIKLNFKGIDGNSIAEQLQVDVYFLASDGEYRSLAWINPYTSYLIDTPAQSGTYYVRVYCGLDDTTNDNQADNAAYQISLTATPITNAADAGATFSTATNLTAGASPIKNVMQDADVDVYRFTLTQASNVTLTLQGLDGGIISQRLNYKLYRDHDGDGQPGTNELAGQYSTYPGSEWASTSSLEPGTYYVWVTQNQYESSQGYRISLNTTAISGANDAGSTYTTAKTLTAGAAPFTDVIQTDDIDVYRFTLTHTSQIAVALRSLGNTASNPTISAAFLADYDLNNTYDELDLIKFIRTTPLAELDLNEILEAGTYYIWITGNAGYQISLNTSVISGATDAGNTVTTATTLTSGATPVMNVVGGDFDYYKFTLPQAADMTLVIQGYTTAQLSEPILVYLFQDLNGDGIADNSEILESYQGYSRVTFNEALEAGTYFVRISGYHSSGSNGLSNPAYLINMTATPIPGATDAGNSLTSTNSLQTNGTFVKNVVQTGDTDVYRFTTNKTIDVVANIQGIDSSTISENIQLRWGKDSNNNGILDSNEILQAQNILGQSQIRQLQLSAGTYYIEITSLNNAWHNNTSYQISVTALEPEIEIFTSHNGEVLIDDVSTVDFGTAFQHIQTNTRTFQFRNTGSGGLRIQPATLTGDGFEIVGQNLPADLIIAPGMQFSITVQMKNTLGSKTGTIRFFSSDADEGDFRINLTGNVIPPPTTAPTNLFISADSAQENQLIGEPVGTFSAFDPNEGDTFTYSLTPGIGSNDNAAFTIVGNELRTNANFDFEAKSSYSIRVRVTDQGGLYYSKAFTIFVTDVFEPPVGSKPLPNLRNGVAGNDNATGSGYMMYSQQNVRTRFSSLAPNNADNFINVRLNGTQWQYDNNISWVNFTPTSTDVLVAAIDFTTDSVTMLKGNFGIINGLSKGYADGNLLVIANRWNGQTNAGEFGLSGSDITFAPSTVLKNLRNGVAATDSATGTGYMMYSQQNIHTRFSSIDAGNADNFIVIRNNAGQWQYDNNSGWVNFTPTSTDVIVGSLNFDTGTTTTGKGNLGVINGIQRGYLDSDLRINPYQWAGAYNHGEFTVTGTYITFAPRTSLTGLRNGVGGTDNATGTGYMMYSQQNVRTRFSGLDSNNADNFINVRYFAGQWQYDNNSTWVNFVPTSSDRLIASLDFTRDSVSLMKGNFGTINGIAGGYLDSNLTITPNNWAGVANPGEYHLTGTFITFMPTV